MFFIFVFLNGHPSAFTTKHNRTKIRRQIGNINAPSLQFSLNDVFFSPFLCVRLPPNCTWNYVSMYFVCPSSCRTRVLRVFHQVFRHGSSPSKPFVEERPLLRVGCCVVFFHIHFFWFQNSSPYNRNAYVIAAQQTRAMQFYRFYIDRKVRWRVVTILPLLRQQTCPPPQKTRNNTWINKSSFSCCAHWFENRKNCFDNREKEMTANDFVNYNGTRPEKDSNQWHRIYWWLESGRLKPPQKNQRERERRWDPM